MHKSPVLISIGGSVVECSPATRAARVRFPADASFLFPNLPVDVTFASSIMFRAPEDEILISLLLVDERSLYF